MQKLETKNTSKGDKENTKKQTEGRLNLSLIS